MPAGSALDEVLLLLGEDTEERVVGELLPVILRQPAHVLKLVKRPVSRAVLGVAHRHVAMLRLARVPTRREKTSLGAMAGASAAAGAVDLGEPVVPVAQARPAEGSKSRSSRYADTVNRGEALLSQAKADIPATVRLLEQAVAMNPDKPAAHMNLAIAHQRSDRHIEASLAFLAAMERYPESTEKWFVTLAAQLHRPYRSLPELHRQCTRRRVNNCLTRALHYCGRCRAAHAAYDSRCFAAQEQPCFGRAGPYCECSGCAALPPKPEWMSSAESVLRMATRLAAAVG